MDLRAKSVSLDELKEIGGHAAEAIKTTRMAELGKGVTGYFPDWGVVGGMIHDIDLAKVDLPQVMKASSSIAAKVGPVERGLRPVVTIDRDILIFGYFPPEPIWIERF